MSATCVRRSERRGAEVPHAVTFPWPLPAGVARCLLARPTPARNSVASSSLLFGCSRLGAFVLRLLSLLEYLDQLFLLGKAGRIELKQARGRDPVVPAITSNDE